MSKARLIIVGAGGFGRVVSEHAINKYDCAFVDDGYDVGTEICGVKVVGRLTELDKLLSDYKLLIVAIGNNTLRENIYKEAKMLCYDIPNIIADNVYISPYTEIGRGCIFLNNVCVQNGSHVGDGVILNPGVEIHHGSSVDNYALIYTNSVIRTYAKVGKRAKIGSNVTVSNNAIIYDDEVVDDGQTVITATAIGRK